ncbi:MAG: hypothetical protein DMG96_08110 [Acidobacteria bacterium]|nr:MAG: hypothetical protein DMG98_15105 [Acidobacteriota bacterium]PYV78361.1 MAG: hypothetical protein DMG96_08110 [Acidobacteriota bacterium]
MADLKREDSPKDESAVADLHRNSSSTISKTAESNKAAALDGIMAVAGCGFGRDTVNTRNNDVSHQNCRHSMLVSRVATPQPSDIIAGVG